MADTLVFHGREYRHARHIESGVLCGNCHSNAVKHGTILVTPEDCDRCHALKKPATHTSQWLKDHGEVALSGSAVCKACHQNRFCDACHDVRMTSTLARSLGI